jgi:hypothetical protein
MGLHNTRTVNPHNVLNSRRCKITPPYFTTITIPIRSHKIESSKQQIIDDLDKWIYLSLNGRYSIAKKIMVGFDTKISINKTVDPTYPIIGHTNTFDMLWSLEWVVGFEEPSEASYFVLSCPILKDLK